jgi:chromosomal replication initiation ATPase DnaA
MRRAAARELIQIGPEISDRAELTVSPDETTIRFFVMTRGAERAWSAINRQLAEQHGAAFWICGPSGVGKTHFLNYIAALSNRAGRVSDEAGRDLTIGMTVDEPARISTARSSS